MQHKYRINTVRGREILDSRGNPTVEVEVALCGGAKGLASVPSGASTGAFEAVELRDKGLKRYRGMGVKKAVQHVNDTLSYLLEGKNALNQADIDGLMIREDGTKNKARLGANAILGTSMAVAKAAGQQPDHTGIYDYAHRGQILSQLPGVELQCISRSEKIIERGRAHDFGGGRGRLCPSSEQ